MAEALIKINFSEIEPFFHRVGIPLVGAVDYEASLPQYQEHVGRYEKWVKNGSYGEMEYLNRGLNRRQDPRLVFPETQGVIAVAIPYPAQPVGTNEIRYARYLNGTDYHVTLREKMETAMEEIKKISPSLKYKVCVDTSAVLERAWAALCGLGWIGKNTLLIHPQLGSYLFLGVVLVNARFDRLPQLHPDYCGKCTRCMDACPTKAIPQPHYLESRECISYLTLEKRGAWEKPFNAKGFVAGCDLCQEVCPFNSKVAKSAVGGNERLELDLEKLMSETEAEYKMRVKDSALSRVKFADFKRNLTNLFSNPNKS